MRLPTPLRKAALLVHILSSVGWIGAITAFLSLALTGLNNPDPQTARAVYIAMEPITRWNIVPLAVASLATGLLLSLTTQWGLLRHYWVIFKLLINLLSLPILLLHTKIIHRVAVAAVTTNLSPADLYQDRAQLVTASVAALAALLFATLLSVYKPKGITSF